MDREQQDLVNIRLGMGEQVIRHHQSPQVAYGIPLGQAAIWGCLVAVCTTILTFIFAPSLWWQTFFVVLTFTTLIVWAVGYFRWVSFAERMYRLEDFLGLDLNRDNYVGEPEEPASVDIWLHSPDRRRSMLNVLPASPQQLKQLARGLLKDNRQFTEAVWTGAGKTFSQLGFRALRFKMEEFGYAYRINPDDEHSAWELTDLGEQVLETWLSPDITPSAMARAFAKEIPPLPRYRP